LNAKGKFVRALPYTILWGCR